ncbi:putative transposase [Aeromonas salmonicida subsp. pectinolytica 34mel]|nr:putative transposase [Aeromonas salmonicida subsp. pectinolytica 34mel]
MPPLKAQLLLEESLSAYFPEMVFTDSGITVQLHRNTQLLKNDNQLAMLFTLANLFRADQMIRQWERSH